MKLETSEASASPEQIETAARWIADHWAVTPQPLTRYLRESFGLGFDDAVKAMVQAKRIVTGKGGSNVQ